MDSLSGLTSQPNLGSIVMALRDGERDTGLDPVTIRAFSDYWEAVRRNYRAFESDLRWGASEVYLHEMPGGQFTNLKEQARAMGLEDRWHEVARVYADVNRMFGDIFKVTPTSKVVGDLALYMVSSGLSADDVLDPEHEIAFPESVIALMRGELGQPPGGWPEDLQRKVLAGEAPIEGRPAATMPSADLEAERERAEQAAQRRVSDLELASHLMYPDVFADFAKHRRAHGRVDRLPTPVFFYGMQPGEEIAVDIAPGKTLVIRFLTVGEAGEDGQREVFFELNGQSRRVKVPDRALAPSAPVNEKAEKDNPDHVPAPMPGVVTTIAVAEGGAIKSGDVLMTLEAMKMETAIRAPKDGKVARLVVKPGRQVDAKDLLVVLE